MAVPSAIAIQKSVQNDTYE